MLKRYSTTRWFNLGALLTAGTLFQAGGCNFDTTGLASSFFNTFVSLAVNSYVNGALGLGTGGFGF
jgi:hypothetical protein